MQLPPDKKIYFISDFHLGAPDAQSSLRREKQVVSFLNEMKEDAHSIFIVGDLFDFWFEYKKVVPKGYVRILGKIAELTDAGIAVHFFVGNHDMWMKNYFQTELNVPVYYEPKSFTYNNKKFFIGHGDGLGPSDHGYKAMKKVFRHPLSKWLFGLLPSRVGIGIANYFSQKSRDADKGIVEKFHGEQKEWLLMFSREILKKEHYDFFVFGHRHLPIDYRLTESSRYINLGEWINFETYAVFDGQDMVVKSYTGKDDKIYRNW